MNTTDVVRELASRTGISQEDVKRVVNGFTDLVTERVAHGHHVTIRNLGRWFPRKRSGYLYFNPRTRKRRILPDRVRPDFKAAIRFKTKVEKTAKELGY